MRRYNPAVRKSIWIVGMTLVVLFAPLSAAPAANRLGLGFGLSYMELRDDVLVPLAFRGPHLAPLQLSFDRRGVCDWLALDCGIGLAALFDRNGFLGAVYPIETNGQYLARVARGPGAGDVSLGVQARWSTDIELLEYWDDEHMYWLTAIGLGPAVGYTRTFGAKERLDASLGLAAAAFASRPPLYRYTKTEPSTPGFLLSNGHKDLRFATLDKYQAFRWQVAWTKPLKKTDFTVVYRGRFARASWPRPVMVLEHSLSLAWGFRL